MAKAKKCDVCGKFYTVDEDHTAMTLEYIKNNGRLIRRECYDVCAECTERIVQKKGEESKEVPCATCDVPDLNCHEQCKEK